MTRPTLEDIATWLEDCEDKGFHQPPFSFASAWPVVERARQMLKAHVKCIHHGTYGTIIGSTSEERPIVRWEGGVVQSRGWDSLQTF